MGFKDYRVRFHGNLARIEVAKDELPMLLEKSAEVTDALGEYFKYVTLDLKGR